MDQRYGTEVWNRGMGRILQTGMGPGCGTGYGTEAWNGSFKQVWNGGMERGYGTGVVPELVPDLLF